MNDKVLKDLMAAFAGESQANRKYLAFSKQADKEGFPQVARLFRAAAQAETVHALNHLKAAAGIKSTEENLKEAVGGEHYEFTEMYPPMLENAEKNGEKAAARTFMYANEVEKIHHELYSAALKAISVGKDLEINAMWVCPVCGMTFEGEFPDNCPVCGVSSDKFEKVE